MMHVRKMDKRYDGHDRFTHRVEFLGYNNEERKRDQIRWVKARNWLWQNFGPSAELNLARDWLFDGQVPKWAWDAEKRSLYLKDESLSLFLLTFERWKNAENV